MKKQYKNNSVAHKRFALEYAKTDNGRKSIDTAYPDNNFSIGYKRVKAHDLLTKPNVILDIQAQKHKLEVIASKAVDRLDEIISDGKEHNALIASQFVYEQVHGKATQRIQTQSAHVMVTYDLTGGNGGEVPQSILDKLQEMSDSK